MRSPAGSGSVGWTNGVSTSKMTAPTQIANAIASPPTMVTPGYFTSIRPPSLRSSESPSNHARARNPSSQLIDLLFSFGAHSGDSHPKERFTGGTGDDPP